MSRSDPELRERIAETVRQRGVIRADSIVELRHMLGEDAQSRSSISKAVRSLHYNQAYADKHVALYRPHTGDMETRPYHVSYTGSAG